MSPALHLETEMLMDIVSSSFDICVCRDYFRSEFSSIDKSFTLLNLFIIYVKTLFDRQTDQRQKRRIWKIET